MAHATVTYGHSLRELCCAACQALGFELGPDGLDAAGVGHDQHLVDHQAPGAQFALQGRQYFAFGFLRAYSVGPVQGGNEAHTKHTW